MPTFLTTYLNAHLQAALFSFGRLWHTPWASGMTIAAIAITLSLPVMLLLILANINKVTQNWQNGAQITLFLLPEQTTEEIAHLTEQIHSRTDVAHVRYISPQQGMRDLAQHESFRGLLTELPHNPLPPVLEVHPMTYAGDAELLNVMSENLQALPGVSSSQLDMQWLNRLHHIIALLQQGVWFLALLLCSAVFLVITNTLRLVMQKYWHEIEVFKLVGATDRFIRRPFLYSGFFYGLSGGIFAWWFVTLLRWCLQSSVHALAASYQSDYSLTGVGFPFVVALLAGSIVLGVCAAYFAVNRHIAAAVPR